ncbi:MAG: ATP-binding cassette domain-containing protein [Bdellovibrionales bacterium]|nr:ATP-binding cassette domain-containing protein [Bdellovibrionales bacterium]
MSHIRLENLRKSFGPKRVLDGLSLEVRSGEIVFVIGKSGTGKSVLLKHIVGLMQPDAGEIYFEGEPLCGKAESEWYRIRRQCGMVFQHPALLDSLSVLENVAFGLRAHRLAKSESELREAVAAKLAAVNLGADIMDRFPPELSFAVQKRVSLARTLAIAPDVLLFDEPTTAQDPVATRAINELIHRLSRTLGVSSLVVSHDMHCALAIADRIVMLDGGKAVAQGSPQEMLESKHPLVAGFMKEAKERLFEVD